MRDPKRITAMLILVEACWKRNPDLRLGQLLSNCAKVGDLYYLEDDTLAKRLKEVYHIGDS